MTKLNYFLFIILTTILLASCRKDEVNRELPEPNGNVLLLELDDSYNFQGGVELQSNQTINTDTLPIVHYRYDPNLVGSISGYIIEGTSDTILQFENHFRVSPAAFEPAQNFSVDPAFSNIPFNPNLFHEIHGSDNQCDLQLVWDNIKTIEMIYAYGNLNNAVKMSVMRRVVYEYDSQVDVSIPVMKFFVVVGY